MPLIYKEQFVSDEEFTSPGATWYRAIRCSKQNDELIGPIGYFPNEEKATDYIKKKQNLTNRLSDSEYAAYCEGKLKPKKAYYLLPVPIRVVNKAGTRGLTEEGKVVELLESLFMKDVHFGSPNDI